MLDLRSFIILFIVMTIAQVVSRWFDHSRFESVKAEAKEEAAAETLRNFICPYCDNVVTGFTELDRAMHVSCIDKSKADLEAERKKPQVDTTQDEYFIETGKETCWGSDRFQSPKKNWKYNTGSGYYDSYQANIYRNGELINTIYRGTKTDRDAAVQVAIDLDKHKRKTIRKRK